MSKFKRKNSKKSIVSILLGILVVLGLAGAVMGIVSHNSDNYKK